MLQRLKTSWEFNTFKLWKNCYSMHAQNSGFYILVVESVIVTSTAVLLQSDTYVRGQLQEQGVLDAKFFFYW